jgi:hypothetical protein
MFDTDLHLRWIIRRAVRTFGLLRALITTLVLVACANTAAATPLESRLSELTALGDRFTGTDGATAAADLIEARFRILIPAEKAVVGRQRFRVPVRIHHGSLVHNLHSGESVTIAPFSGNALSPSSIAPPGLEAQLVDVGRGTLAECNGKRIKDAVVLMDLDSGTNWRNAAMLGARALIYVDDLPADRNKRAVMEEAMELNPIEFPRFLVSGDEARRVFGTGSSALPKIRLTSSMTWENRPAENIYCLVPGTDPSLQGEVQVVEGFYDTRSMVPGRAPGADESLSLATLLQAAEALGRTPPPRSTLLLATAGHAQNLAGMRSFVWALSTKKNLLREEQDEISAIADKTERILALLARRVPLTPPDPEDAALVREAMLSALKTRVDDLNTRLTRLRLESGKKTDPHLIRTLADEKMLYRRLTWKQSYADLIAPEEEALAGLIPEVRATYGAMHRDAVARAGELEDGLALRSLLADTRITSCLSLHLSSRGDGIGAFNDGWMYRLRSRINRTRFYSRLDDLLRETAAASRHGGLFKDTLRPSRIRPWRNFLPDHPAMGGEVAALASLPGLTLATVHDMRPLWGTPDDRVEHMNLAYARAQADLVTDLITALGRDPVPDPGDTMRKGFATLNGDANFLRQGELFPDLPAAGTVLQIYQGEKFSYAMVDALGNFHVPGLADKKHVQDKAIIEGFRFDPETGRIIWAIDKRQTGKSAYRVKMQRRAMDTSLIMFSCAQTTLFDLFDPRTFGYMTKIDLLDGRTEAEPVRFWYSRLDTWTSTLSSVYLDPGTPLKLTMSDTVLGKKMVLLNNSPDDPHGTGYRIGEPSILTATEFRAARDMWNLISPRIANLEEHGIFNERIRAMQTRGTSRLTAAEQALDELRYDDFLEHSRASWALASRVYNDIDATQKDVLLGVLFYIALFVPFAYCMERLVFAFTDIHKRIAAFLGFLGLVIAVIYSIHPAFNLTYSPLVVILAFFILGLSVLVSLIIFFRFEQEMASLQRRAKHVQGTGISPFKAFAAAFTIGVTNLRRRKVRTALTCTTLIILTFTIMNFTAVKSGRQQGQALFSTEAPYRGFLLRTMGWQDLPHEAEEVIRGSFGPGSVHAPRVWLENRDRTQPVQIPLSSATGSARATAVVGLAPEEPQVTGLDAILTSGRWFTGSEPRAVLLPAPMAEQLGAAPVPGRDRVRIWGLEFTLTGTFDPGSLDRNRDLDGEPVTPVYFPSEAATEISEVEAEAIEAGEDVGTYQTRYQHLKGLQTIILPARTLTFMGGRLKGVAVRPAPDTDFQDKTRDLTDRYGLMLFSGGEQGTALSYAADTLQYSGVSTIVIPLAIAVLIVLNTMIGSVYERKREIGVYTSVGLAPSHVSFLFIAESLAFAVISAVTGYLLAQTAARFLAGTWLWAGMTANYSSMAGVAAMILVILVVLASVIYPSRVAANIAIPDVNRSWSMPEASGGVIEVTLPFLIKIHEQECAGGFLMEYYQSHQDISHGRFSSGDLDFEFACPLQPPPGESISCFSMSLRVWLAPFDFGVRQRVTITCCPAKSYPGFLEMQVRLSREAGEERVWHRLNKAFLNDLRKQLLIWRSLDAEMKEEYARLLQERG